MGWLPQLSCFGLRYKASPYNNSQFFLTHGHEVSMPANMLLPNNTPNIIYSKLSCWLCLPQLWCGFRPHNAPVPDCVHKTPDCDSSSQPQLLCLTALSGALPFKPSPSAAMTGNHKPSHNGAPPWPLRLASPGLNLKLYLPFPFSFGLFGVWLLPPLIRVGYASVAQLSLLLLGKVPVPHCVPKDVKLNLPDILWTMLSIETVALFTVTYLSLMYVKRGHFFWGRGMKCKVT